MRLAVDQRPVEDFAAQGADESGHATGRADRYRPAENALSCREGRAVRDSEAPLPSARGLWPGLR